MDCIDLDHYQANTENEIQDLEFVGISFQKNQSIPPHQLQLDLYHINISNQVSSIVLLTIEKT